MLRDEAAWLGALLADLPDDAFPLLNLASGTRHFRRVQQPFIHELVFQPLAQRGVKVIHADLKKDEGVDVSFDFTDDMERKRLVEDVGEAHTVVCCNMLEHLAISPQEAADHLIELVRIGGYLVLTVPRRYGYHPDPIDNGYRPTPQQLGGLFRGRADVVHALEIEGRVLWLHHVGSKGAVQYLGRVATLWAYKPHVWSGLVAWFWRPARVSCVVMRRTSRSTASGPPQD